MPAWAASMSLAFDIWLYTSSPQHLDVQTCFSKFLVDFASPLSRKCWTIRLQPLPRYLKTWLQHPSTYSVVGVLLKKAHTGAFHSFFNLSVRMSAVLTHLLFKGHGLPNSVSESSGSSFSDSSDSLGSSLGTNSMTCWIFFEAGALSSEELISIVASPWADAPDYKCECEIFYSNIFCILGAVWDICMCACVGCLYSSTWDVTKHRGRSLSPMGVNWVSDRVGINSTGYMHCESVRFSGSLKWTTIIDFWGRNGATPVRTKLLLLPNRLQGFQWHRTILN